MKIDCGNWKLSRLDPDLFCCINICLGHYLEMQMRIVVGPQEFALPKSRLVGRKKLPICCRNTVSPLHLYKQKIAGIFITANRRALRGGYTCVHPDFGRR